jgi:hypothetical protein
VTGLRNAPDLVEGRSTHPASLLATERLRATHDSRRVEATGPRRPVTTHDPAANTTPQPRAPCPRLAVRHLDLPARQNLLRPTAHHVFDKIGEAEELA